MWVRNKTWEAFPLDYIDTRIYEKSEWFQVDDLIAPVIIELNKKGYLTKYCCQGHLEMLCEEGDVFADFSTPYIAFQNWVKIDQYPTGWSSEDGKSIYLWDLIPSEMLNNVNYGNIHEYFPIVFDIQLYVFSELLKWVKSLPKYSLVVSDDNKEVMKFHEFINTPEKYEEFRKKFVGQSDNHIIKSARARCCRAVYANAASLIDASYHGDNVYVYKKLYEENVAYALEHRDDPDFQKNMYFKTKIIHPNGEILEVYL